MTRVFEAIGRQLIGFVAYTGRILLLAREVVYSVFTGKVHLRHIITQLASVGFASQLVVIVTGAFTGAVLTAQSYFQLETVGLETAVGAVVTTAMFRELGPILTGLMLAGRVGAAMTAEIGTMKVSEQIDALRSLAINPVDYLVAPRVVAMFLSIPLLIMESIFFGILASWAVATGLYGVDNAWFWEHLQHYNGMSNLIHPSLKGLVFGQVIAFIACLHGLEVTDGAVGVGRSTTKTVVISSLTMLVFNFFLSLLLNLWFPAGFISN